MESTQIVLKMLQDERSKCDRLEAMLNEQTAFREMADKKLADLKLELEMAKCSLDDNLRENCKALEHMLAKEKKLRQAAENELSKSNVDRLKDFLGAGESVSNYHLAKFNITSSEGEYLKSDPGMITQDSCHGLASCDCCKCIMRRVDLNKNVVDSREKKKLHRHLKKRHVVYGYSSKD